MSSPSFVTPTEECAYCGRFEYIDMLTEVGGYPCCAECYTSATK